MLSPKNLLIIDHNDSHYDLLRQVLASSKIPFRLIRAADSDAGKKFLKSRHFDLILTECEEKVLSDEWISGLKKMSHGSPVVVLTSRCDQKQAVTAMKMGADDYIVKNRDALKSLPEVLLKTIKTKKEKRTASVLARMEGRPGPAGRLGMGGINLLARNLKTITNLINNPSRGWARSKKHFKQLHVLEKEIRNIKDVLKNFVS
ncbi:MAG: response regulator [Deltaproteobacteria bacterium]|nr:response regulator [Deltaproteobacteria bacterium]